MLKILFIGPYRQRDGWGNASKEYLRALKLTGHEIVSRPIYIAEGALAYDQDDWLKETEKVVVGFKPDVVIQNVLPQLFTKFHGCRNIGLSYFESSNLQYTPWVGSINMLGEIWVTSAFEKQSLLESGVYADIQIVKMPVDVDKFNKIYPLERMDKYLNGYFTFYFIGEKIARKNISALIKAFHREFHPSEPVNLILKVNMNGVNAEDVYTSINADIVQIKRDMKLFRSVNMYKNEIVLSFHMPEDQLYGLHQKCDCFVTASSGEAFSKPAFDAMGFRSTPIVNKNSSMAEFMGTDETPHGYLVDSHRTLAIGKDRALPFINNGRDEWMEIDILDLQKKMRKAYNNPKGERRHMKTLGEEYTNGHSYQSVADSINGVLC